MATEPPSQETEDHFDDSVDSATHAVIAEFEWMGLPEGDQLSELMVRINDALTQLMQEWK
jgi:hypothetical protein